jgi:2-oxoglutarate dehydrogenase E2 component (dihydrolipoamide succinyltransferase)
MAVELKIPESGESISEVQIGEWRKGEGDHVERDEIVVELETDKASMELPAPASGTLSRIIKQTGEIANVGDVIGRIAEAGEEEDKPSQADKTTEGKAASNTKADKKSKDQPKRDVKEEAAKDEEPEQKQEREQPEPEEIDVRPRVMPAARRALAEHRLEASEVKGSGPGGRILKEDVLRHVREARKEQVAEPEPSRPAPAHKSGDREEEKVPMTMLRRRIAERLVEVQQTAALLTTFNEIDMSAVNALRDRHGEAFEKKHGVKLGFMSFFVKASIEALKRIPEVNAEIRETDIVYKNYFDIGVAVSTDRGLVVPIVRDADRLSFAEIEKTIGDLARRARDKKLAVEDLEGGTFTISNGGVFGSLMSTPIINAPQSGILGLHAIQDRPVARDGQVVIRPMMYVALTYDHRIVDGRGAVTFLRHIKEMIETPARILIEI